MSLPNLPAGDKFRREVRTEWGGLNLNENAGDGELIEAMNMSSREFPVLSTERMNGGTFVDGIKRHPFIQGGKLGYIIRNGTNNYSLYDPTTGGGSVPIPLTDADIPNVEYAQMKDRMVIQPWNNIYDFSAHSASNIEVSMTLDNGAIFHDVQSGVTMQDFISDPLVYPWPEVPFSVGDAVTVSGFTVHPENNKTAVIRAIRDGVLYFDADTFDVTSYMYEVTGSALPAGEYSFWSPADGRQYTFTATAQIDVGKWIVYAGPGAESVAVITGGTEYPLTEGGGGTLLTLTESYNGFHADEKITITRTAPEMEFV